MKTFLSVFLSAVSGAFCALIISFTFIGVSQEDNMKLIMSSLNEINGHLEYTYQRIDDLSEQFDARFLAPPERNVCPK